MATPLLQTKLYIPPSRPELVSRPRLIERLNTGLHRKLTLISAPAGFGKTTLLSEWTRSTEHGVRSKGHAGTISVTPYSHRQQVGLPTPRFTWLSLDERDNDPVRFLAYFIGALQTIEANTGEGALKNTMLLEGFPRQRSNIGNTIRR